MVRLWFDVGIKRYTTARRRALAHTALWFDVGIKRYTTDMQENEVKNGLWFDVGIKRYTTSARCFNFRWCCGLM